jgi:hypothetical protein
MRGRVYLPCLNYATAAADGSISAATQTAAAAFVTGLQTSIEASALDFAVLSRKLGAGQPVTLVQCRDGVYDTIRKRAVPGI